MKLFFSSRAFWVIFFCFCVAAYAGIGYRDWLRRDIFPVAELLNPAHPIGGSKNNNEREYKIGIKDFNVRILPIVQKSIHESLTQFTAQKNLRIPALIGRPYSFRDDETPFVFLDFYFDTADFDLDRLDLAYRLRYRWKTVPDFVRFLNGGRNSEDYPIRCELQCKFQRREVTGGFSESVESRFEFRDQSDPFSMLYPAPLPPWPFFDFITIARRGFYEGHIMRPSQECARMVFEQSGQKEIELRPRFAVLDIRTRSHVLIKTPWGNGPMPDDAMIVTLDNFWYTTDFHYLLRQGGSGAYQRPRSIGSVFQEVGAELEFEFERNVAAKLDRDIAQVENNGVAQDGKFELHQVRKDFLADMSTLREKVTSDLKQRAILTEGVNLSKPKQIRALLGPNYSAL